MPDPNLDAGHAETKEHRRIREVYAGYEADQRGRTIWADTPASRYMRERKWRVILGALTAHRVSLENAWCVELGSGATGDATRLREYGKTTRGIVAFDLLPERLSETRQLNPGIAVVAADAARMPLPDGSIGVVYQSTMLSSVLDPALRAGMFAEIRRVLKDGGVFISYD